ETARPLASGISFVSNLPKTLGSDHAVHNGDRGDVDMTTDGCASGDSPCCGDLETHADTKPTHTPIQTQLFIHIITFFKILF
ncbi:MAG: hypothetical protein NDI61_07020, partial [Bdellovibrionaceae bacterium]|nr:hypothetical protein [Pseudobdellovibrionaceae bacterium]